MTINIKIREFEDLRDELIKNGEAVYCSDGFDCVMEWNHRFGLAKWREIQLRPGLFIWIYDEEHHVSWSLQEQHREIRYITLAFQLLGNYQVLQEGIKDNFYKEETGKTYLYSVPGAKEVETYSAQSRLLRARIHLDLDFLSTISSDQSNLLPCDLQLLLEGKEGRRFYLTAGEITSAMQVAWSQFLNCPYQGTMKRLYLESKALELITLQFVQLMENNTEKCLCDGLRATDIDRIHQAKDILIRNLENPPSLIGLARQVGLNDYKLKIGFRYLFGTTVFGYLHQYRMERSQQLLRETQMSVTEVAHTVGYACPTSFSTAFRKKFGVNPRSYRA
ncbi:AraC family transcriptional regulator [Chlorogloeopsis sp. ULAP02]|uniref:helix-turn-helix transcriptional regulator n=1 Tax=Chlorogloeopsis sp. ULAP02 TaxID=3107926 RepID=UPI003136A00A